MSWDPASSMFNFIAALWNRLSSSFRKILVRSLIRFPARSSVHLPNLPWLSGEIIRLPFFLTNKTQLLFLINRFSFDWYFRWSTCIQRYVHIAFPITLNFCIPFSINVNFCSLISTARQISKSLSAIKIFLSYHIILCICICYHRLESLFPAIVLLVF